jgi:hypothetical protein
MGTKEERSEKARSEKGKACISSVLQPNMGGTDLKDQLHMYLLERKKNDKMVQQNVQEIGECHNSEFYDNM